MTDEIKKEIEIQIIRGFKDEQKAHREYFEKIFNQFKWFTGIIIVIVLGLFFFLFDDSRKSIEDNMRASIDQKINDLMIRNEISKKFNSKTDSLLVVASIKASPKIDSIVAVQVGMYQAKRIDSIIAVQAKQLKEFSLSNTLLPPGTIIAFYGKQIPNGWMLCDGKNGTPNLIDRFLMGTGAFDRNGQIGGTVTHRHQTKTEDLTYSNGNGLSRPVQIISEADHLPPYTKVIFIMKK